MRFEDIGCFWVYTVETMMTGSKYKQGIFALFSICLVWFSLLDHGQCAVSFSSLFHRTTTAAVELIVNDQSPRQINATSTPSGRPLKARAINQSVLSDWLYRFPVPVFTKEQITGLQQTNLPVVCLISILHKKNGWHQSSQDDPHLNPLSFI
jgi:hypothetical protein